MANLLDILRGNYAQTHEAFMHANMQHDAGEITTGQLRALSDATDEAYQALASHRADLGHYANPAADSSTIAVVNGVVVDLASPEYAAWYAANCVDGDYYY